MTSDDAELVDLVLGSNLPVAELARQLDRPLPQVRRRIRQLGLDWILERRLGSRGHAVLVSIMEGLFPDAPIVTEQPLGERLMLDVYCPKYRLAAEYHGRQHFEYVEHFHGNLLGYQESVRRDEKKALLCQLKGISLVIFSHRDTLTEAVVFDRMLEAIENGPPTVTERADLERQRDWRKALYQRLRAERRL